MQPLHTSDKKDTVENIKSKATQLNDLDMLQKIAIFSRGGTKMIVYHNICKINYNNKTRATLKKETRPWHTTRDHHKVAFQEVCNFISDNIIHKNNFSFLSFLHTLYLNRLNMEYEHDPESFPNLFSIQHLENKILNTFNKKIEIVTMNKKKIVKPTGGVILQDHDFQILEKSDIVQRAALILRQEILKIEKNEIPDTCTANDLITGECCIPDILSNFYFTLLSGSSRRRKRSSNCQRIMKSFAQDAIFAVRNGSIKPSKHIALGMALKSLTSSKKVINIVNKYGHCCSYTVLEELETEATFASTSRTQICPEDIIRAPNLCTGLAFDNFDRFVDTMTGKDTLHDTVGIIFQNIDIHARDIVDTSQTDDSLSENDVIQVESERGQTRKRKRRTFDEITPELEAYAKKPRLIEKLQPLEDESVPENLKDFQLINFMWMLCHLLQIPNTPMWVGFNSKILEDNSVKQRISYLTPINLSPTNTAVVLQTMVQSQKVAKECHEQYMQVTYDLAIAKIALQIQSTENPRFNNIFIHLGSFHIMMAFFKAIGKFIDNCGLSTIMVHSEILASGSISGFITGKHFNRCKRLHPMLSLALEVLHFKRFLNENNLQIGDDMIKYLQDFSKTRSSAPTVQNQDALQLFELYENYRKDTVNGVHGKTSQYYMIYINLINYYLMLTSSIRTGNFEVFKYVLPRIANLFFTFNQPNYSRWLIKYHANLLKIDETHPGLKQILEKGCFGVKRTNKPFSRQPVDLTLEQTINADAARTLTGITHLTNSISARQRWCKSHSIRSTIISYVLEETELTKTEDITADLEKNRLKKNNAQLEVFIDAINQYINPFATDLDKDLLYNISNGQAASGPITEFLINVEKMGNELRQTFISECAVDESRFEKIIKKNKILTFADMLKKKEC